MEIIDLIKVLQGDISHINRVNKSDIALYGMRVIVTPENIKKMLMSFLDDKISANDLTTWAAFLCIRTEYVSPECEDSNPDYYEDMWHVVQCLSTPEIDGEITSKHVKIYISELDKYF